ncbi:MAG: hypothetical protein II631_01005, partial [Treponema sp.]|nr:hypothetical protein [Treponema sp.]
SSKSNTRALSTALTKARTNAPAVTISLINDSQEKCAKCCKFIKSYLTELADFQKELYKGNLRKDLFEHPDFDKKKAFSSPEAEMAEIKRLYVKTTGKKTFYTDLVQEIIAEDQGGDRQNLRQKLLSKLEIKIQESKKETKTVDPHDLLMAAVFSLGVLGSVLGQIGVKLSDNFDLLFYVRKTFFVKFMEALKKALGIKEKERYCTVLVTDPQSGAKSSQQVQVGTLDGAGSPVLEREGHVAAAERNRGRVVQGRQGFCPAHGRCNGTAVYPDKRKGRGFLRKE